MYYPGMRKSTFDMKQDADARDARDLSYFERMFSIISDEAKLETSAMIAQMATKMSERTAKILFVQLHLFLCAKMDAVTTRVIDPRTPDERDLDEWQAEVSETRESDYPR